ncbi:malonic semialdehyde reductase [Streptosporangium carneum]|uniref:NADH dehydrogenase/NAD(P)H nitroreductase n=1 Tax=Streptosporangium carneum TaxID=47481 RepID=A0A9W6HWQ3_9ACTN|nr:malonic semialdehyde reductase [Streptosporangium carneum]GLK07079.1 putative NADH dehydrogenase/NAD(P)H nitroreductase [Streptosporangium carneum]
MLDRLFRDARTANRFTAEPVPDELLRELYDLVKLGPTSGNLCPARFVFVRTPEARQRLLACLDAGNVVRTGEAPVTVIVGWDERFHEMAPRLFPGRDDLITAYAGDNRKDHRHEVGLRNSSLQGAYLIMAARALGLDCGPLSGFDSVKLEAEFFPDGRTKVNFLCNLGRADRAALFPRLPRLSFEDACTLL